MKKWLLGMLLLLGVLTTCIYIFIPSDYHILRTVTFNAPDGAVKRLLINNSAHWDNWWPGSGDTGNMHPLLGSYRYKNSIYTVSDVKFNSLALTINLNGFQISGTMILIPGKTDSSYLQWDAVYSSSSNPFKKVQSWFIAKRLKKEMDDILSAARSFFSSQENIYGITIQKAFVTDSILLSTYALSNGYPTTSFIYKMVDELNAYAASQSAHVTGLPMLNINPPESGQYMTRIALPVDKKLSSSGNISYKWMLGGGNILIAEVKGGPWQIEKSFHQVENYISDYHRVSPAISFLSLVTDRRTEPDSSRWVTRICYPVM